MTEPLPQLSPPERLLPRLADAGLLSIVLAASVAAQERPRPPVQSVGHGAPVSVPLYVVPAKPAEIPAFQLKVRQGPHIVGPYLFPANPADPASQPFFVGSARNGDTPAGVNPLPVDIFTTKDFYKDRSLWSDRVYLSEPYQSTRVWERAVESVAFEPFACDLEVARRSSGNAVR